MKKSQDFWQKLNKPIYALAPMAGVADSAFRRICKQFGADIVYSEMASAAALVYSPGKTLEMLKFSKIERPYIVQLFGNNPKHFKIAAEIVTKEIKPDGLDINFGCPVKKVQKQGAGAVLMNNPKLAREIIKSVIGGTSLPVSIKTRSLVGEVDVLKFLERVNDLDIKAVMIHGRTLNQGFAGEIDWRIIQKARQVFPGVILANGGVKSKEDAIGLLEKTKADGIGMARGALGRPWIFTDIKKQKETAKDQEFIFKIALEHAKQANKLKGEQGMIEMRKHLCWYVKGLPGAADMRQKLIRVKSFAEIKNLLG